MKTSVIGFPRIGALRELKFASEKYFKNEISQNDLLETAKNLRQSHWALQKQANIDFISSNDFSLYDNTLDTAFLLNIIPERYRMLNVSYVSTYFAMARGYQKGDADVKALAMKKWFNTNYHYIVPEIDDECKVEIASAKLFEEFEEAKKLGIITKPTIVGAFTMLKLTRFLGSKTAEDFVDDFVSTYCSILEKLALLGAKWVQFDEPSLVKDLSEQDIQLFEKIYSKILAKKGDLKILLQTYFGDIRDCYNQVVAQDFDGIGLDFVEGKQSLQLVKENGFPKDKILFAGVVNGKNIWKNNYAKSLQILDDLKSLGCEIVISTSCSLLHVPYTLKNESKLSQENKRYFAFAEEKLAELCDLQKISAQKDYSLAPEFVENKKLFSEQRNCQNAEVQQKVANIGAKDFIRLPDFFTREKIQKERFCLPLFPTTTIGSFPQTADVKANRTAFKKGEISESQYVDFNKKKIAECVALQEKIGLDVLVHGEFERNDMVEYFGENLDGYVFTEKAWVQSYGTRCVKPPIVWGDVSRKKPMTVQWSVYAQSLTEKPMKGMLTGPVTILNWSFPREDISLKECAYQIALAIKDEVLDLESAGIKIIQVDEAALREKLPLRKSDWQSDYLSWAIPAFRLVHSKVKAETQIHTHMCYSEFGDIIRWIDDMDADVITFEASRSDLTILQSLKDNDFKTEVGPGVYDIHSPRVPTVKEILTALAKMLKTIPKEKLWVNPDCGLKTRGNEETIPSLKNLVTAAKFIREK